MVVFLTKKASTRPIIDDFYFRWSKYELVGSKRSTTKESCSQNTFANFVISPTKTVLTKTYFSSTLFDVILPNNDSFKKFSVIYFPFSDHDIITCKCNFQITVIYSPKINEK